MAVKKHMGLRGNALGYSILCTAVLPAYLLYGYNQAVAGGLVSGLVSWDKTFPQINVDATGLSKSQSLERTNIEGVAVSIYTAAGIFGSLFCIWSAEKLGRKKTVLIGAATALIGAVIQASSYSLGQLIAGRVVAGLGNGGYLATVPNLQAETSPPAKRGGVIQYLSVFALAGLAVASWIELGLYFTDPSTVSWRFPLALPIFFALLVIGGMLITPESPRWLIMSGREDEGREIMSALYDEDPNSDMINSEIADVKSAMQSGGNASFADCFKMGETRVAHRTMICCGIQMFQQITGVNCLAYFQAVIFGGLGLSPIDSRILAASVFTFSSLVSMLGVFTVDRFGRRPLLLISVLGNGVSMLVIAVTSAYLGNKVAQGFGCLFVFLFFFFFPVGFLGVTFLYAAEIAPNSVRGPVTAMSTATVWAFNFMTVEVTPTGTKNLQYKFFIIWTVINLLFILPCVYFFFPETRGLSLEAIDEIFTRSKNIFEPVWVAKKIIKGGGYATEEKAVQEEVNGVTEEHEETEKETETETKTNGNN